MSPPRHRESQASKRKVSPPPGAPAKGILPAIHDDESFTDAVAEVVRGIPRGIVLSYGDVARRAGSPRAARAVAHALAHSKGLPWWRVARADHTLADAVAGEQAKLLRAEGVRVIGKRIVRPKES